MGFQWDPDKADRNFRKHFVTFGQAARIFEGIFLEIPDGRRDYGELRFIAIGEFRGLTFRVAYTYRDGDIRIISAWKAGKHDRLRYQSLKQDRESGREDAEEPDPAL